MASLAHPAVVADIADIAGIQVFDTLFGATVPRSIEGAAVRHDDVDVEQRSDSTDRTTAALIFSTGQRVLVDRPLLLGRKPHLTSDADSDAPRFVALTGKRVSRHHALIRIDRWQTIIEDLGSTNGTQVTLPGQRPRQLTPGQPVNLVSGTRVELAGELSFLLDDCA